MGLGKLIGAVDPIVPAEGASCIGTTNVPQSSRTTYVRTPQLNECQHGVFTWASNDE